MVVPARLSSASVSGPASHGRPDSAHQARACQRSWYDPHPHG